MLRLRLEGTCAADLGRVALRITDGERAFSAVEPPLREAHMQHEEVLVKGVETRDREIKTLAVELSRFGDLTRQADLPRKGARELFEDVVDEAHANHSP